jgi:PAS domain-containing protein
MKKRETIRRSGKHPTKAGPDSCPVSSRPAHWRLGSGLSGMFARWAGGRNHPVAVPEQPAAVTPALPDTQPVGDPEPSPQPAAEPAAGRLALIYEKALDSALSGIAFAGLDGRVTYANRAFLRMWGYDDQAEVMGRFVEEFWKSPATAKGVRDIILTTAVCLNARFPRS